MTFIKKSHAIFSKVYILIFGRPSLQWLNNIILQLALRGAGYNNYGSSSATGEDIFINFLSTVKPKFCIDVGANLGRYSENLLSNTSADVLAFEPLPYAFNCLKNLSAQYPTRFTAVNMGIGDKEEMLDLHYVTEDSEWASFDKAIKNIDYIRGKHLKSVKIPVTTLDSYYQKNIKGKYGELDLLKIDVEGFEYEVLLGSQEILRELKPKFIQIEYNWHQLFKNQSLRKISTLLPGYTAFQLLPYGSGLVRRDLDRPESNIFHYSNFIFVHSEILSNEIFL